MTKLDPRVQRAIAENQSNHSPPPGLEQQMLAQFHARLGGPPPGGGDGGLGGGVSLSGQVVYALKVVAAVASLTAAGLGGLWAVGKVTRSPAHERPAAVQQAQVESSAADERRSHESPSVEVPSITPAPEPLARATADNGPAPKANGDAGVALDAKPPAGPGSSSGSSLVAELELIDNARQATPTAALKLLDRHAREFPDGELRHERESLRIIALCELDRSSEAQRVAQRFFAAGPGPLLIQRVSKRCGQKISVPRMDLEQTGNGSP